MTYVPSPPPPNQGSSDTARQRKFERLLDSRLWEQPKKRSRIKLIFAWYDLWVGFFWDRKKKWLYFFPVPCIGIIIKFKADADYR